MSVGSDVRRNQVLGQGAESPVYRGYVCISGPLATQPKAVPSRRADKSFVSAWHWALPSTLYPLRMLCRPFRMLTAAPYIAAVC